MAWGRVGGYYTVLSGAGIRKTCLVKWEQQVQQQVSWVSVCVCLRSSKGMSVAALEPIARRWIKERTKVKHCKNLEDFPGGPVADPVLNAGGLGSIPGQGN